jgi:thymidylate kinase
MKAGPSLPWASGLHIAFTGIDGAGKTTQAGKLAYYIQSQYGPTYLAEPRTDFISKLLHVLAWQHGKTSRREYYGHHVVDISKAFDVVRDYYANIAPLLAAGMHVVEPRSVYCRSAMALAMSGNRDEKTEQILALVPKPDLLFWIDTDPSTALSRVEQRGIDVEKLDDLQRFSNAFQAMSKSHNWVRIDGNLARTKIYSAARKYTDKLFIR